MRIIKDSNIETLLKSRSTDLQSVAQVVDRIIYNVSKFGDSALLDYCTRFDGFKGGSLIVSEQEFEQAYKDITAPQLSAVRRARDNVLDYSLRTKSKDMLISNDGITTGYSVRPLERAGIYVPGGKAPYPSTVVMCAMPAKAAGVKEIIMATPMAAPLTLVAARECGVDIVYKMGGAQAIAAMAFGTKTVKKADIIVGPGNAYVTAAKKAVYGKVAIDMLAGPSEIVIIADSSANPEWLAADLLSQAEHDELAMSILITNDENLALKTAEYVGQFVETLSKAEIAKKSVDNNGAIIITDNIENAIKISNKIAPEHLELCIKDAENYIAQINNAGAVFLGNYTPEPVGDYWAGPNHVLPTDGCARFCSSLSTQTFLKHINIIKYDKQSLNECAEHIEVLAKTEGFEAHALSVRLRRKD